MEFVNDENCIEELFFNETETRKRTLRKCNNYAKAHGRDDIDYHFDRCENMEVAIEFKFFDGYAIATDGSGLYLTYPTLDKVSKSNAMQHRVEDYVGVYDGKITQFDIALYYGVLKFSEGYFKAPTTDNKDDDATTDEDKENNTNETLITVSSLIFKNVVELTNNFDASIKIVNDIAKRFDEYWDELMSRPNHEEYDYFVELTLFLKERLDELYDKFGLKEEDFDDKPEDDEQTFKTEEDVRAFLTLVIRVIGWAFHPDDSMCDYIDRETEEYLFTQEEAEGLDKLMDEAFEFCNKHDIDIYDLSNEISKELYGNLFDDDEDKDNDEPEYKIAGFDEAMKAYADAMDKFNKIMGRV